MKTRRAFIPKITGNFTLIIILVLCFAACKKDAVETYTNKVSAFSSDSAKSDGVITVQTGILPPVTQQSFIYNGNSSTTEFQITSTKHIFLYDMYFTATCPFIEYITIKNYGVGNVNGNMEFNGGGDIAAGSGASFIVQVHYENVDSSTSGTVAQLCLTNIIYRTDDNVYHSFYAENAGKAKPMCLVNNAAHIIFQDPSSTEVINGCREIAEVKLTGDTGWTLNSLPINILSPYDAAIPKTKLMIKNQDQTINTKSDSIILEAGQNVQTVINFARGFNHIAGQTEVLKIYAHVVGSGYNTLVTTMSPLNSLIWTDGLRMKLTGAKNNRFFKQPSGQSNFSQ